MRFEFRTTGQDGLLFYGRRRHVHSELLALRLVAGDLYYKIHCSTVSADVLIPHRYKLNDGRWHSVVVSRSHIQPAYSIAFIYLFIYLLIDLFIYVFIYLFIYLFMYVFIYLFMYLCICVLKAYT